MLLTCRYVYFAAEVEDGKVKNYSFLEYFSYIFLFTNFMVGTVPFSDFINFIRLSGHYSDMKFTFKPILISLLKTLYFLIGEMIFRPKFDFDWFDTWHDYNLLEKHGLVLIIAFFARLKYYLAFKFT